jgi:mevalonate kinase
MNNCPISITAMKQALEELEEINKLSIGEGAISLPAEIDDAMDALRQAIEQAEKQEQADQKETAAELRRLHAVNQELLGALHSISLAAQDSGSTREGMGRYARAAIAKATGETE